MAACRMKSFLHACGYAVPSFFQGIILATSVTRSSVSFLSVCDMQQECLERENDNRDVCVLKVRFSIPSASQYKDSKKERLEWHSSVLVMQCHYFSYKNICFTYRNIIYTMSRALLYLLYILHIFYIC